MKLHLTSNSVQFRITPIELKILRETGKIESCTLFSPTAGERLMFVLQASETSVPRVRFAGNAISVAIPKDAIARWAESENVTIEGEQVVADREQLKILIEKDFRCIETLTGEDESDRFPNPALI